MVNVAYGADVDVGLLPLEFATCGADGEGGRVVAPGRRGDVEDGVRGEKRRGEAG